MKFLIQSNLKYYILLLICWISIGSAIGQTSTNPFDIKHASDSDKKTQEKEQFIDKNPFNVAKDKEQRTAPVEQPSNAPSQTPKNPFDINVINKKPANNDITLLPPSSPAPIPDSTQKSFLFWVILSISLLFTSVYSFSRSKMNHIYDSFWNENLMRQIHRIHYGSFSPTYLLLYLLFFINLGLFLLLLNQYFNWGIPQNFSSLLLLIGGVSVVYLAKHLLLHIVSYIFPIDKEVRLYSFMIMVFGIILGIFLLPVNLIITYAPKELARLTIYLALGAIIATYFFRSIRGISIGSKYLMLHKFHFFLYLCAIEFLPFIILIKIVLLNIRQ